MMFKLTFFRAALLPFWLYAVCAAAQSPENPGLKCHIPSRAFLESDQPDCFQATKTEADRAFKKGCWDDAAELYRAAKLCRDANQDDRAEMTRRIEASRDAAERELRGEKEKAVLQARHAIAANRANDAQELLRRRDRHTAYRLATFANEYIAPPGQNNAECLQAAFDAWLVPPAEPGKPDYATMPFSYELAHNLGDSVQLHFVREDNDLFLYGFAPTKHELMRWKAPDFELEGRWPIDTTMRGFEVSPDGNTAVFYSHNQFLFVRDQQRWFMISAGATRHFCFSPDGDYFYFYVPEEAAVFSVRINELFPLQYQQVKEKTRKAATPRVERIFDLPYANLQAISAQNDDIWLLFQDTLLVYSPVRQKASDGKWGYRQMLPLPFDQSAGKNIDPYVQYTLEKTTPVIVKAAQDTFERVTLRLRDGQYEVAHQERRVGAWLKCGRAWAQFAPDYTVDIFIRYTDTHSESFHLEENTFNHWQYRYTALATQEADPDSAPAWFAQAQFDGTVRLWPLSEKVGKAAPPPFEQPGFMAYSPDGQWCANVGEKGRIELSHRGGRPVTIGQAPWPSEPFGPVSLQVANTGWVLCAQAPSDSFMLAHPKHRFYAAGSNYFDPEFAFDQKGRYAAVVIDFDSVAVYALQPGGVQWLAGRRFYEEVDEICFIEGADELAIQKTMRGDEPAPSTFIPLLWRFKEPNAPMRSVRLENFPSYQILNSADGQVLHFTNSEQIKSFHMDSLTEERLMIRKIQGAYIEFMALHPSKPVVAIAYTDGRIVFRDTERGRRLFIIKAFANEQNNYQRPRLSQLQFSPDGARLLTILDGRKVRWIDLDLGVVDSLLAIRGGQLTAFSFEQIGNWELDKALEYPGNFKKLASSGDLPLIRAFFDFYIRQAIQSNRMDVVAAYCQKASELYEYLDEESQKAQQEAMLGMYGDYLWKLINRNQLREAEAVLQTFQRKKSLPGQLIALKAAAHIALLKGDFKNALEKYIEWEVGKAQKQPGSYEHMLALRQLNEELEQLDQFGLLSPEKTQVICQFYGGLGIFNYDFCNDSPTDGADLQKIVSRESYLTWKIFLALSKMSDLHHQAPYAQQKAFTNEILEDTRQLQRINPTEGRRYREVATLHLAAILQKEGLFERGSARSQPLFREAIDLLEKNGPFYPDMEPWRLDTLAGIHYKAGNHYLFKQPEKALREYEKGLAYAEKVEKMLRDDGLSSVSFQNRVTGPLLLQKGRALLFLNQLTEAEATLNEAAQALSTGDISLYYGHLALLKKDETSMFLEYGAAIYENSQAATAISDIYQFAERQKTTPQEHTRLLSAADRLRRVLFDARPELDTFMVDCRVASTMADYFRELGQWETALKWSEKAMSVSQEAIADYYSGQARMRYEWISLAATSTLAYSYDALMAASQDRRQLERSMAASVKMLELRKVVYHYYLQLLLTNMGHTALLLGEKDKAIQYYAEWLGVKEYGQDQPRDILEKDWRDLEARGIVLPDLQTVRQVLKL